MRRQTLKIKEVLLLFEYVKDLNLKPARAYSKRKKTDLIVLHHFAADSSVKAVHEYHLSRGHKGIDYNIVIQLDGEAVWGRGIEYEGGHVLNSGRSSGMNQRSIGIACQGNFQERTMTNKQKETLMKVIFDCIRIFPTINSIIGHKEVKNTACPGKFFPLDEAKEQLLDLRKENVITTTIKLDRLLRLRMKYLRGDDVKAVQAELNKRGFDVKGIDGIFGPNTKAAVIDFQKSNRLLVDGIVGKQTITALGGQWIQ